MPGMTPLRLLSSLVLLAGLLLAGCATRSPLGEITASVESVRPVSLPEGRAEVTVRYLNDNIVPVSFVEATHKLYLRGAYVTEIENRDPLGLAPTSTTTRKFTILFAHPEELRQLVSDGAGDYKLSSVFEMQYGDERDRIKGETSGRVLVRP